MLLQRFRRIEEIVLIPLQNNFDNFLFSYAFSLNKGYLSYSLNSICLLKFILYRCLVPLLSFSVGYDSLCLFSDDVCVSSNIRTETVIITLLLNSPVITAIKPSINVQTTSGRLVWLQTVFVHEAYFTQLFVELH